MEELNFNYIDDVNEIKKYWWLHDSFWHAAAVKEFGIEKGNKLNLEVNERTFRMLTMMWLRKGIIKKPESIEDLVSIYKTFWRSVFFDEMYYTEPITIEGNKATWFGTACNAYESLKKAGMTEGYECGCKALRNGVMKALRLKPLHTIEESLVKGDGRCVITFEFERQES